MPLFPWLIITPNKIKEHGRHNLSVCSMGSAELARYPEISGSNLVSGGRSSSEELYLYPLTSRLALNLKLSRRYAMLPLLRLIPIFKGPSLTAASRTACWRRKPRSGWDHSSARSSVPATQPRWQLFSRALSSLARRVRDFRYQAEQSRWVPLLPWDKKVVNEGSDIRRPRMILSLMSSTTRLLDRLLYHELCNFLTGRIYNTTKMKTEFLFSLLAWKPMFQLSIQPQTNKPRNWLYDKEDRSQLAYPHKILSLFYHRRGGLGHHEEQHLHTASLALSTVDPTSVHTVWWVWRSCVSRFTLAFPWIHTHMQE